MTNNYLLSIITCVILCILSTAIQSSSALNLKQTDIHKTSEYTKLREIQSSQTQQQHLTKGKNTELINTENQNSIQNKAESQQQQQQDMTSSIPLHLRQKLTVIGYASDEGPARHLISFGERYNLDLHLIGLNKPWGGFNDKISGFYDFIESIDNTHNDSIILILDAYDTVPICSATDLLYKFNTFNADIVMSTGKDCWPDPNVGDFLYQRLTDEERETHKFFPWFLCPNSGAIMGKHDAMLSMFRRVQKLVSLGNGSCSDFEGNKFSTNTQSDQRCYTTYYVELTKYHEYELMKENLTKYANNNNNEDDNNDDDKEVIDISKLNIDQQQYQSEDGSVSKKFFLEHGDDAEIKDYFKGITMKLDYRNELFLSMGGMMFMDIDTNIINKTSITMRSKITNGSSCILHGNGPGVILWRSYIKQIKHNGNLFIDDYVLRVGVDFFHWILWWIIMPCERLSHWLSIRYNFDIGMHSTTFSEEVIWRFHVWTFVAVIIAIGLPLLYWYKYRFRTNMKIQKIKGNHHRYIAAHHHKTGRRERKSGKSKSGKSFFRKNKDGSTNHPITQQLVKQLQHLEIMVHHNGNIMLKTQKKN